MHACACDYLYIYNIKYTNVHVYRYKETYYPIKKNPSKSDLIISVTMCILVTSSKSK